jgi:hypothetical protein
MARCLGSPSCAAALLKLGQNIHKKIVPIMENMSDVLADAYKYNVKHENLLKESSCKLQ